MQTEDFVFLAELEATYWWFVGMRRIQESLLDPWPTPGPRRIVDIGCGTGGNLSWLRRYEAAESTTGLDIVPTALDFCRGHGHRRLVHGSATAVPLASNSADLVTIFDVIQQLPGDGATLAMRELERVLAPGGRGFIRAAAYEWMRSGHDRALATPHRFTVPELTALAEANGLDVVRATYANTVLLPLAALRRLVLKRIGAVDAGSDVKPLPGSLRWLNTVFTWLLIGEARLLRSPRVRLPFGLSAIVIVRKPVPA